MRLRNDLNSQNLLLMRWFKNIFIMQVEVRSCKVGT